MTKNYFPVVFSGHVDHGKSSLIGRILFDTKSISPDRLDEVKRISAQLGRDFEYCFLLDSMQEEREQNVTIDVTEIFFSTKNKDFVIIDAPGHREFTKNMITGASRADAAVLVIDVNEGICEQTRRHAYILSLLGVKQIIVAVNKMDICEYSEQQFTLVKHAIIDLYHSLGSKVTHIIPISATSGDNIMLKSMDWYTGPTILEALDTLETVDHSAKGTFCMPIQDVYVLDAKRVYAGMVASGKVQKGDPITVLPSNQKAIVTQIREFENPMRSFAVSRESVGLEVDEKLFIERGSVFVGANSKVCAVQTIEATLFWLAQDSCELGNELMLRCATQEIQCKISAIHARMNSSTLETISGDSSHIYVNDVAQVTIQLISPIVIDLTGVVSELSKFILERNFQVVAGGILVRTTD